MLKIIFFKEKNLFLKKNEEYLKNFHNNLLSKWSAC